MKTIPWFVILILIIACEQRELPTPESERTPLTILAQVDNANPTNIEQIRYTITYHYQSGVVFTPPEIGTEIAGFRIVDMGQEGPKKLGNRMELKKWYDLEPDVTGTYILPAVSIEYTYQDEKQKVQTNPIYINVGEATYDDNDKLIEDTTIAPIPDDRYWFYSLIGMGILIIIILGIVLLIRYSRRKIMVPPVPPHEKAKKRIDELLRNHFIEKGDFRQFYFGLSEIIRAYIDELYVIKTSESTQEEIKQIFKKCRELEQEHKDRLLEFFQRSDFAKFAKWPSTQEGMRDDLKMIVGIIDATTFIPTGEGTARA